MSVPKKRLMKELELIQKDIAENVSIGPIEGKEFKEWIATIFGPVDTPYEGGVFQLNIRFPENYPFVPPKVKFVTPIFHPNIGSDGSICIDILKDNWSASLTIKNVILSICSLLDKPNPEDPLSPEVAVIYKNNIEKYKTLARAWTMKYAS